MTLPRKSRLAVGREQISFLRKKGQHIITPFFTAYYTRTKANGSRFGIIIGTSISKKAVLRNKLRRQCDEAIRNYLTNFAMGTVEMIIYPKKGLIDKEFGEIAREISNLLGKIGYDKSSY